MAKQRSLVASEKWPRIRGRPMMNLFWVGPSWHLWKSPPKSMVQLEEGWSSSTSGVTLVVWVI